MSATDRRLFDQLAEVGHNFATKAESLLGRDPDRIDKGDGFIVAVFHLRTPDDRVINITQHDRSRTIGGPRTIKAIYYPSNGGAWDLLRLDLEV